MPGIGSGSAIKLIESGMSCRDVFEVKASELSGILSHKQISALSKARREWNFEEEQEKLRSKEIRFVSRLHPDFPKKLVDIPSAPFGIYVRGKLPDPKKPSVVIIGARMCSDYGRYMARQFGRDLALSGVQIISGMARGVDGISQNAALLAGGTSFAVLGCGADICYPQENRNVYEGLAKSGGIISEFPPGTKPIANFFPMRNRIISALSDVLLVIEARQKSGTSITVDTALEQGKEVLAVPGRVTDRLSDGCNNLISQGAGIAIRAEDVLDRIRMGSGIEPSEKMDGMADHESDTEGTLHLEGENEGDVNDPEISLDREILEIVDIIPISMSSIMEELFRRGRDVSVPVLMNRLLELTGSGRIIQNGAYYRRLAG